MEPIYAALVAAGALLIAQLVTALSPRWNVASDVAKQEQLQSNQARRQLYADFSAAVFAVLSSSNAQEEEQEEARGDLGDALLQFRREVIAVGSDEVVRAFNDLDLYQWEKRTTQADFSGFVMRGFAELWLAMRRDIGYPKTKLSPLEAVAVFLSDAESQEEAMRAPRKRRF